MTSLSVSASIFPTRALSHSSEDGSYLRLIDSCITQLKAQGPSRTCNDSKEEEEAKVRKHQLIGERVDIPDARTLPQLLAPLALAGVALGLSLV